MQEKVISMGSPGIFVFEEVRAAVRENRPLVALESEASLGGRLATALTK